MLPLLNSVDRIECYGRGWLVGGGDGGDHGAIAFQLLLSCYPASTQNMSNVSKHFVLFSAITSNASRGSCWSWACLTDRTVHSPHRNWLLPSIVPSSAFPVSATMWMLHATKVPVHHRHIPSRM